MRICVVSQEYPRGITGGIGTQSRAKAQGLARLGHEVEVVTAGDDDGPQIVSWEDGAVRVHEARTPGGEFPVYRTETYWLGYTWAVLAALRTLGEHRGFDVIDFPEYSAEGLAFQLDRQEDDPTAVAVHLHGSLSMFAEHVGWPQPGEPLHDVGAFMEDLSIRRADRLLSASRSLAEFTADHHQIPIDRIDVVDGAVDTDAFSPHPAPAERRDDMRLLFVGSIAANKGVLTVFEAFARLAPAHPELSLVIAGTGDQELIERIREDALRAGVADRIELLGFVEHNDLPAVYRSADLLAAPSQYEGGLGMVYLEAMACGVPVIATAAGGAAEAVVHGETGLLLRAGDIDETTAAIQTLLSDPRLRSRMGEAGRTRVEQRFAIDPYARRVADAYRRALEHRERTVVTW